MHFSGRGVEDVEVDAGTGALCLRLSDESTVCIRPTQTQASDDPPTWELITPEGAVLEFGPGLRWQITTGA